MLAKYVVMDAIQAMPETISFSEIKEAIEIIEANRRALADIKAGRVYTTNEAKKRVLSMAKPQ